MIAGHYILITPEYRSVRMEVFDWAMQLEETFKISAKEWHSICQYDSTTMLSYLENKDKTLSVRKLESNRLGIFMQMLLHLNEDFDDDLLLECMQLLIKD